MLNAEGENIGANIKIGSYTKSLSDFAFLGVGGWGGGYSNDRKIRACACVREEHEHEI